MPTRDEIERSIAEARGAAVLARMTSPDPHEGALPIRHRDTAQIVAYVPAHMAEGLVPVVENGLVVGDFKETENGRQYPFFYGREVLGWGDAKKDERWIPIFTEDGAHVCDVLL